VVLWESIEPSTRLRSCLIKVHRSDRIDANLS
jgi:hypothetical protein